MKSLAASTALFLCLLSSLPGAPGLAPTAEARRAEETSAADPVRAELVAEVRAIRPGEPFWVGVRLEMRDGWHVNWINPGDAGLAPEIAWTLPPGFSAGEIQWPYARRYEISGLAIFGYDAETVLACRVAPPPQLPPGSEITIGARVTWLACREACLPGEAELSLTLPAAAPSDTAEFEPRWQKAIEISRRDVPLPLDGWRFSAKAAGDFFTIEAAPPNGETAVLETAAFFPFLQGVVENSEPQTLTQDGDVYRLRVRRDRMSADKPERLSGVLFSPNGWGKEHRKAVSIDVPID
jgi:thiol:disulfide interchange protein DsbD